MSQGQTTYLLDQRPAVAGMPFDDSPADDETFMAAEDLPMGVLVRMKADQSGVETVKSDAGNIVGVVLYQEFFQQGLPASSGANVIKAGTPVAVRRKGRVWMQWDGTSVTAFDQKLNTPSAAGTPATQGQASSTATSANVVRTANIWCCRVPKASGDVGPDGSQQLIGVTVSYPS